MKWHIDRIPEKEMPYFGFIIEADFVEFDGQFAIFKKLNTTAMPVAVINCSKYTIVIQNEER